MLRLGLRRGDTGVKTFLRHHINALPHAFMHLLPQFYFVPTTVQVLGASFQQNFCRS